MSCDIIFYLIGNSRLPDLPYIPGTDAAGVVEKIGSEVQGLSVGQRVFVTGRNSGAYAEYIVIESIYVFPLHPRLTFAQGAALGTPYFTAYKALIIGAKVIIVQSVVDQKNLQLQI